MKKLVIPHLEHKSKDRIVRTSIAVAILKRPLRLPNSPTAIQNAARRSREGIRLDKFQAFVH